MPTDLNAPAAPAPETTTSAPDPIAAFREELAALKRDTANLQRENGTLRSQVSKMPRAQEYIDALSTVDAMKADLLAKGITQEAIDDLADKPRALKELHGKLVGNAAPQDVVSRIAALEARVSAPPAAPEPVRASDGMRLSPAAAAPIPGQKSVAELADGKVWDAKGAAAWMRANGVR